MAQLLAQRAEKVIAVDLSPKMVEFGQNSRGATGWTTWSIGSVTSEPPRLMTLIVLDLAQHQFEEARELYADRWLGFSESTLAGMFERAGFSGIDTNIADRETSSPHFHIARDRREALRPR